MKNPEFKRSKIGIIAESRRIPSGFLNQASKPITVHCKARVTKMDLEGELGGMTVHHNPNSIANMLSLKLVVEMHRVKYDSWDWGGVSMVHTPNRVVEFKPNARRLHYMDVTADEPL